MPEFPATKCFLLTAIHLEWAVSGQEKNPPLTLPHKTVSYSENTLAALQVSLAPLIPDMINSTVPVNTDKALHGIDQSLYFIIFSAKLSELQVLQENIKITRCLNKQYFYCLPKSVPSVLKDLLPHTTATSTKSDTSRLGCQAARIATHTTTGTMVNAPTMPGSVG